MFRIAICELMLLYFFVKLNENKERKIRDTHPNLFNIIFEEAVQYLTNTKHPVKNLEQLIDKLNAKYKTLKDLDNITVRFGECENC